jgi:hypothetical protein
MTQTIDYTLDLHELISAATAEAELAMVLAAMERLGHELTKHAYDSLYMALALKKHRLETV